MEAYTLQRKTKLRTEAEGIERERVCGRGKRFVALFLFLFFLTL